MNTRTKPASAARLIFEPSGPEADELAETIALVLGDGPLASPIQLYREMRPSDETDPVPTLIVRSEEGTAEEGDTLISLATLDDFLRSRVRYYDERDFDMELAGWPALTEEPEQLGTEAEEQSAEAETGPETTVPTSDCGYDEAVDELIDLEGQLPKSAPPGAHLEAIYEHNQRHAVVQIGGKVRVMVEDAHGLPDHYMTVTDHRQLYANQKVKLPGSEKPRKLPEYWMGHPERRTYLKVVFRPTAAIEIDDGDVYNLWRGFAIEPSPAGSCDRFLQHIKEVVCSGNAEYARWVVNWLAHLAQHPEEKPGTALVMYGAPGTGKSLVGATMKRLLGPHHLAVSDPRHVTGNFNKHLERCLLLQADEAFFAGQKRDAAALKHLVTGETAVIEPKGVDSYEIESYLRLMVTSNEEWVWPAEAGERRAAIFEVSDHRRGDTAYFDRLFEELENGGYERLLDYLLMYPVDRKLVRRVPITEAAREQVAESLSPDMAWALELLESGEIPAVGDVRPDGSVIVPTVVLHETYRAAVPRFARNRRAFGKFAAKYLLAGDAPSDMPDRKRVTLPGGRTVLSHLKRIPSLREVRSAWSARGEAAVQEWSDDGEWRVCSVDAGDFDVQEVIS